MKLSVIIPAAGTGTRFGATSDGQPVSSKIEARLADRPIFMHAIECFQHRDDVGQIILAVHPEILERFRLSHGDQLGFLGVLLVAGGVVDRWETVNKALDHVNADATHVAVHDAARPLAGEAMINRIVAAAEAHGAAIPVMPVNATLKRVGPEMQPDAGADADPLDAILGAAGRPDVAVRPVLETLDRCDVVEVQTPQIFRVELLRRAHAQLKGKRAEEVAATDDAALVEMLGETVMTVPGELKNLKITRTDDLKLAEIIAALDAKARAADAGVRRLFTDDDDA